MIYGIGMCRLGENGVGAADRPRAQDSRINIMAISLPKAEAAARLVDFAIPSELSLAIAVIGPDQAGDESPACEPELLLRIMQGAKTRARMDVTRCPFRRVQ